ncbi:MAG: calcineurin-like phosphoesterase family protein [Prolixibacteraceae bacterium]|jgi:hypothetical protein|nr:calcineurin-like phosphoesterase family protein [Prolixibacteraceae bacterium]
MSHRINITRYFQSKGLLFFLLLFPLFVQCEKNSDTPLPEKEKITSDLTGIDVKEGMTLVGIVTDSETGSPWEGVVVSDGYTSAITDANGIYQMKKSSDARHVFCSLPADCEVLIKNNLPDFYAPIYAHYDIFRHDFKLKKMPGGAEKFFTLICVADPQVKTGADYTRCEKETMPDIKAEKIKHGTCYGITLGDIVFDTPDMMFSMKNLFPNSGVKFFHVIGNHDHYQETTKDLDAIKNYETCFGPTNYSFNRGNAHIIAMDNVIYTGKQTYSGGFTEDQIKWLKSDLQYVPKDKLVIVCVHIPIRNQSSISRCNDLYAAISPYNEAHIMSGHTHYNQNMLIESNGVYEHVHGAACGAWWTSTINSDGTPNGYGVYKIKDNKIEDWYYKPTKYNSDFQIRMYPLYSFKDNSGYIIANVWNADESWKVELFEDGIKTGDMQRYTDYEKCAYQLYKSLGKAEPSKPDEATGWFRRPDHLYRLPSRSNTSYVEIKATDRFGNVYTQNHFTTSVEEVRNYQ